MRAFAKIILSASLVALPVMASVAASDAAVPGRGTIVKLNGEGHRICRAFDRAGQTVWQAKARGILLDGAGSGNFNNRFNVRMCFETKAECNRFIGRIENIIHGIDYLTFAGCKIRNG